MSRWYEIKNACCRLHCRRFEGETCPSLFQVISRVLRCDRFMRARLYRRISRLLVFRTNVIEIIWMCQWFITGWELLVNTEDMGPRKLIHSAWRSVYLMNTTKCSGLFVHTHTHTRTYVLIACCGIFASSRQTDWLNLTTHLRGPCNCPESSSHE